MAARNLRAVEEGDPGHVGRRKLAQRVKAPAQLPAEPDWAELFPEGSDVTLADTYRMRATAHAEWEAIVPILHKLGLLAGALDVTTLADYCLTVARVQWLERIVSLEGPTVTGSAGGMVRHPAAGLAISYRTHLRALTVTLGLSPHARAGLKRPEAETDDASPWSR